MSMVFLQQPSIHYHISHIPHPVITELKIVLAILQFYRLVANTGSIALQKFIYLFMFCFFVFLII